MNRDTTLGGSDAPTTSAKGEPKPNNWFYIERTPRKRFLLRWNDTQISRIAVADVGATLESVFDRYFGEYFVIPSVRPRQAILTSLWRFNQTGKAAEANVTTGELGINTSALSQPFLRPALWHEMFHLLQAALGLTGLVTLWMDEGSATWSEIAYAARISSDIKLTYLFTRPDEAVGDLRDATAYCAAPLFCYLAAMQTTSRSAMGRFFPAFSKAIRAGSSQIDAWEAALPAVGLRSWAEFHTSFLASRFSSAWTQQTPYYPNLVSENGGSLTIVPDFRAATVLTVREGQPINQTYQVGANKVKTIRINGSSTSQRYWNTAVTTKASAFWAAAPIARATDRTTLTPTVRAGGYVRSDVYYPSNDNGILLTLVGPAKGPATSYKVVSNFETG